MSDLNTRLIEVLDKNEDDLKKMLALEKKIQRLLKRLTYWVSEYKRLKKKKSAKGRVTAYLRGGGSHKHVRGAGGLKVKLSDNVFIYAEGGARYDGRGEVFYETGIQIEITLFD